MRKYFSFFLFVLLCTSCETQFKNEESITIPMADSRKQTEIRFAQAIQGIPLVIPLPEESDPTLFLMPVSNDKDILKIACKYMHEN